MIFPILETEDIVQVGDMTRLSALKSFVSKDESDITKVEIQPEATASWIDVTGDTSADWYLDWAYPGATRQVLASVRITTVSTPQSLTNTISVITPVDDKLFSVDTHLTALEPDLLKYVPDGRKTFLNVHRAAQSKIIQALDEMGIIDVNGHKLTKAAIVDVTEVSAWSRDLTLSLIFKGLINAKDDVFTQKSNFYAGEAEKRKARAVLRLDLNNDGTLSSSEVVSMSSADLVRR